jgi:hypothetical protein
MAGLLRAASRRQPLSAALPTHTPHFMYKNIAVSHSLTLLLTFKSFDRAQGSSTQACSESSDSVQESSSIAQRGCAVAAALSLKKKKLFFISGCGLSLLSTLMLTLLCVLQLLLSCFTLQPIQSHARCKAEMPAHVRLPPLGQQTCVGGARLVRIVLSEL